MKKKDQSSGSAKTNQQKDEKKTVSFKQFYIDRITFPDEGFFTKNLATRYWLTGKKEDYPKRIYNRLIALDDKKTICVGSELAHEALKIQQLETFSSLYHLFDGQIIGKKLISEEQTICWNNVIEQISQKKANEYAVNYVILTGEGLLDVSSLIDKEDAEGNPIKCMRWSHFEKGIEIHKAQITQKFFEKHWEDILLDGKSGTDFLSEAEDNLNQVCEGFVPRRLKKQVLESKVKKEETK